MREMDSFENKTKIIRVWNLSIELIVLTLLAFVLLPVFILNAIWEFTENKLRGFNEWMKK